MNTSTDHQIVVLGAGYTGLIATARLARYTRRLNTRITLVNPSSRFTERLRMHQVAAGQELTDYQIPVLLKGTGVRFRQAAATAIDTADRVVTLDNGARLHYDTLVYALGSATDTSIVPGTADHAWTLNDPRLAHRLSRRLPEIAATGGAVTVCGGGLTGIEAAAEIAEAHPALTVNLVCATEPGSMMGEKARAHLNRVLGRLGVVRMVGVKVTKVLPDAVRLDTGELVPSDLILWTSGVRVPRLAAQAGIATDEKGLIITDPTLRSVSHPEIHAIGDAALVRQAWGQVHGTCQSGVVTADYTAAVIARLLRGKPVKPLRFGYFHQPVSLGRKDAVIQFTNADDTPKRWYLKGKAAVVYKEQVSSTPPVAAKMSRYVKMPVQLSKGGRVTRKAA
ncbi:NAD(P)/FAD-dependent oxidoreductase [Actinomadura citrea]|uniref:NADH dehydrogenase FAD-containing subunit n=1 Tax=Actinomadura citrea TaxID=46158 RepID=A0A7Y9GAV0_9ACTN|nr:FAD-dependent oxidoreductase [Actinomadura citrea]NYE13140.1 NADH dehydrogenase FAD-containing subunit [Actinomadura citrea]GGU09946.1 oxidoreductase [Actinomadura citrea]